MPSDEIKDLFAGKPDDVPDLQSKIKSFHRLIFKKRALKNMLEDVVKKLEEAEEALYLDLENANIELVKTKRGTFYRQISFFASIDASRKEEGYRWLKEQGYGHMIYQAINHQTFSALIKELKSNDEHMEIPDFVNTYIKKKVRYRKG